MTSTNRIAVLLATYNGEKYLEAQLDTIAAQENVSMSVFIRDDGSKDKTVEIVKKYIANKPGYHFLDSSVPTKSATANFFTLLRSVNLQDFDYFAFADQDDLWRPNKLVSGINALKAAGAEGYSCNMLAVKENGDVIGVVDKADPQRELDYLFQGASAGCTYVLSRKLVEKILSLTWHISNESFFGHSHDWLAYLVARSYGMPWVLDKNALILYRQHGNNDFGANIGWKAFWRRFKLVRNGWYYELLEWNTQFLKGSPEELKIVEAMRRRNFSDRLWLAWNSGKFRRARKDRLLLALSFLLLG